LQKDQQTLQKVVDFFINMFQIFLPRYVSAYGCHPQGVVSAREATQAMFCALGVCGLCADYDSARVPQQLATHMPKHVGVKISNVLIKKPTISWSICCSFCKQKLINRMLYVGRKILLNDI
jgi:hypothetical protein